MRVVLAGPEMPNFQLFWKHYGAAAGVVKLGVLSAQEKKDFFSGIDVFALPSRSDSFGLVLLEAWANGVANIGYRAGGIAWVIRDEADGLLVRCGDVGGLATALLRLGGDAELRRRLGEAGRERTRTEFHWEDKLAVVEKAYREVAAVQSYFPAAPFSRGCSSSTRSTVRALPSRTNVTATVLPSGSPATML